MRGVWLESLDPGVEWWRDMYEMYEMHEIVMTIPVSIFFEGTVYGRYIEGMYRG